MKSDCTNCIDSVWGNTGPCQFLFHLADFIRSWNRGFATSIHVILPAFIPDCIQTSKCISIVSVLCVHGVKYVQVTGLLFCPELKLQQLWEQNSGKWSALATRLWNWSLVNNVFFLLSFVKQSRTDAKCLLPFIPASSFLPYIPATVGNGNWNIKIDVEWSSQD